MARFGGILLVRGSRTGLLGSIPTIINQLESYSEKTPSSLRFSTSPICVISLDF